jgi:hypothetical protein
MGVEEMRHSSRAFSVCVLILLGLACIALLAGCDNAQEAAYKSSLISISNRWNDGVRQLKVADKDLETRMKAIKTITDPYQAVNAYYAGIDAFTPKYHEIVDMAQGLQAELNQLQPPAKYATEHKILVNGMSTLVISLQNADLALGQMRTLNMGAFQNGEIVWNNAETNIEQGIANVNMAGDYLFPTNWPLIIGVLVGMAGVSVGLGIWTGKMGDRDGRSFKAYFCFGFFLWFLGVLIAWLKTRRRREVGGYAGVPPGAYPAGPQGYPPPAASLPGDLLALENPFGLPDQLIAPIAPQPVYAQPQSQPAPAQAPPVQEPPASPFGSCPACGVQLPQSGAFCFRCGSPLPEFGA